MLLTWARQEADLHLRQLALGEQLQRLGDADGGRPRVRLGVVAGHHHDRVARRGGVDRLLDRLSGGYPRHSGRGRRGDAPEGETQNRYCTYAQSSLRHFHLLLALGSVISVELSLTRDRVEDRRSRAIVNAVFTRARVTSGPQHFSGTAVDISGLALLPTTTSRDPEMRLAERANVLSKRASDERTGHPIGDRGWPPDRGYPGSARTARAGSRRAVPRCQRGSAGARQAGQSDSGGAVRRDYHGGRATLPRPVNRDARGRAVRAPGTGCLPAHVTRPPGRRPAIPGRASPPPPWTGSGSTSTSDAIRPAWSSTPATGPSRVVRRPWSICRWQSSACSGVRTRTWTCARSISGMFASRVWRRHRVHSEPRCDSRQRTIA